MTWKLLSLISICYGANVLFVGDPSYQGSVVLTAAFTTELYALSQGRLFANTFCLKQCASKFDCVSAQTFLSAATPDLITCRLYSDSLCNYTAVQINSNATINAGRIWDKMPNLLGEQKACIAYPYWTSNRNCTAVRQYIGFIGLKCDDAPRICRDYLLRGIPNPTETVLPLWPWGITGDLVTATCDAELTLMYSLRINGEMTWIGLGNWTTANSTATVTSWITTYMNFSTIAQLTKVGTGNCIFYTYWGRSYYSGCYFAPDGSLNISSFRNGSAGDGMSIPLVNAPFVRTPSAISTCGLFWYLTRNGSSPPVGFSTCQQKTRFFAHTANFMWNSNQYGTYRVGIYIT